MIDYEIDAKRKIVDFYLKDDDKMNFKMSHEGMHFDDVIKWIKGLLQDMTSAIENGEPIARIEGIPANTRS